MRSISGLLIRRCVGSAILAGILAGYSTACSWSESQGTPPNIVLVVIDTLRADHLDSYGYPHSTAPTLEAVARQGVLFERVIAPSSWTKTSMASIVTSREPDGHGVRRVSDVLPGELITLAEVLSAAGYHTIGINTNPWLLPRFGFRAGFDVYENPTGADAASVTALALKQVSQARHPFDQGMLVCDDDGQRLVHNLGLADDDLLDFSPGAGNHILEVIQICAHTDWSSFAA